VLPYPISTVWRKVFGYNRGIMVVDRFYESVYLHDLQQRQLVPGEREQNVEILFTPSTAEELFVACLWIYVEAAGDAPGFYTFAAITDDPPLEVVEAGHDRCPVPIQQEDIDAWLNPDPNDLARLYGILDRRARPFYEHQLAQKTT
jgi:putative SOS response-associated peptidase YedK